MTIKFKARIQRKVYKDSKGSYVIVKNKRHYVNPKWKNRNTLTFKKTKELK